MTESEFQAAVKNIVTQRQKEVKWQKPNEELVQELVSKALGKVRAVRIGLSTKPDHDLQMADLYLSLARGDESAMKVGDEN